MVQNGTSKPKSIAPSMDSPTTGSATTKITDEADNNTEKVVSPTTKRYSADDAETAQMHALTRETYTMSLRQLRQERQSWRADKLELDHLRKLVNHSKPISISTQVHELMEEKAHHEEQLDACHEEIQALKEQVHTMQTEQKDLRKELAQSQQRLHGERSWRAQQKQALQQESHPQFSPPDGDDFDTRRIKDLEEQIHKWEVLFFESAEMGERQIERLEQELEQVQEELSEAKEELSRSNKDVVTKDFHAAAIVKQDHEIRQLQTQVEQLENKLRQKDELLNSQTQSAKQREIDLTEQLRKVSQTKSKGGAAPDPFADRLAALAKEMNSRESATQKQHERELQASKDMANSLKAQLSKANQTIAQLEKRLTMPMVIREEDEASSREDDNFASSERNGDLELYVAELEKQVSSHQKESQEISERLNQERIIAKNREDALKRQLEDVNTATAVAKTREVALNKELKEARQGTVSVVEDKSVVEDLRAELREKIEELGKSQTVNKELRQKLEISLQLNDTSSSQVSTGNPISMETWKLEREELQSQIQRQQKALDEANQRLEATQRENSQLRQVKDSLMGIDREMEELIESLEPLQAELAEKSQEAKEARDEAAALKQDLNKETVKRQEADSEKKVLEDEVTKTKERLNSVYCELKDEQAAHEEEVDKLKQECAALRESLEYHKTSLSVFQEAMQEANEEIRNSSPRHGVLDCDDTSGTISAEMEKLRGERNKLQKEYDELRIRLDEVMGQAEQERSILQEKLSNLQSEKDALELDASMANQEHISVEDNLRKSLETIESLKKENAEKLDSHPMDTEIKRLERELEEARGNVALLKQTNADLQKLLEDSRNMQANVDGEAHKL